MDHELPDESLECDGSEHALSFTREERLAHATALKDEPAGVSDHHRSDLVDEFYLNFKDRIRDKDTRFAAGLMVDFVMEAVGEKPSGVTFQGDMSMEFLTKLKHIFALWYQADSTIKRFALAHNLKGIMPEFGHLTQGRTPKQFADWLCDGKNPNREFERVTKQNVNKAVKYYYFQLISIMPNMPLPEGMRKPEACEKMRQAALASHANRKQNQ